MQSKFVKNLLPFKSSVDRWLYNYTNLKIVLTNSLWLIYKGLINYLLTSNSLIKNLIKQALLDSGTCIFSWTFFMLLFYSFLNVVGVDCFTVLQEVLKNKRVLSYINSEDNIL